MAYTATDKRRVYLACRSIFAGGNALLRQQKKIKKLVNQHKKSLKPLLDDFGVDKVVEILKLLLETQTFQSELKEKLEFPELFLSSPARDVQRAASENEAARSVEEALEEIASVEDVEDPDEEELPADVEPLQANGSADGLKRVDDGLANLPSLYPSYLPYKTQHLVLTTAQRILEEACFEFARKWLPSILESRGWDCPEAVELTKWTRMLSKRRSTDIPPQAVKQGGAQLVEALLATNKLRHHAVHRLPASARGVDELIKSATNLADTLQDTFRAAQLEDLHGEISSKIKAMELNKNVLEDNLSNELREIQHQREELDRREKTLIDTTLAEDQQNKSLIGDLLDESVQKIFHTVASNDKPAENSDEEANESGDVKGEPEQGLENGETDAPNGELAKDHGDSDAAANITAEEPIYSCA